LTARRHARAATLLLALSLLAALPARAEQMLAFDGFELHYAVIPTNFLTADVARRYGLVRGEGRAIVSLSLLRDGQGLLADTLTGEVKNLLSQVQPLDFQTVTEGDAVYYLAPLRHSDRDTLRFTVQLAPPGGEPRTLRFQQKLYTDGTELKQAGP
jgi:hypothetical protein